MTLVLIASLATAAVTLLLGLPLVSVRRNSIESPGRLAGDALLAGTAMLVVLGSLWTWFGAVGAALVAALVYGACAWGIGGAGRIDRSRLSPTVSWGVAATAAVLVAGSALRLRSVEFLAWTGDMGNYVNAANRLADTGVLQLGFPPGFAVYLALPARLFGVHATTASVPFLGLLTMIAVLRLCQLLGCGRPARLVAVSLAALSPVMIWYSSFPVSESLQAPLTVFLVALVGRALVEAPRSLRPNAGDLTTIGVTSLALGLTRGTGPLLVLPFLVMLAACAHPAWRHLARHAGWIATSATAGLVVAYIYGVDRISGYFVGLQIATLLPSRAFSALDRLGLLHFGPRLVLASAALMASLTLFGTWLGGRARREEDDTAHAGGSENTSSGWGTWPLPLTAAAGICVVALLAIEGPGEIWNQIGRFAVVLVPLGLIALFVPAAVRGSRGPYVVLSATVLLLMLGVQVTRFDTPRAHAYFLYWDRYLFSEVLPMLMILTGLTVSVCWEWAERAAAAVPGSSSHRFARSGRIVVGAGAVLLVVGFAVSQANSVRLTQEQTMLAGSVEFYERLDDLLDGGSGTVLWTASGSGPDGWPVFPNSWHAFGRPLVATYGHSILNLEQPDPPFSPDPVLDANSILDLLGCTDHTDARVVEFTKEDTADLDRRLAGSPVRVESIGSVEAEVPILRHLDTKQWETMGFQATVWQLDVPRSAVGACPLG